MEKPMRIRVSDKRILRKLNISGLNIFGSSLPPPDIITNPSDINMMENIKNL
jgi:hypothetical protein